jgi:transposase
MIVAEIGIDMARFGTAARLAAWSGVAPGNDESAGKQRSGKTRKGNQVLRAGLTQLAHGAVHTKGTYVSALYRRLAARRGKRRAILAVAHSIMGSVFHMLSRNEPYRELGPNYFDERRRHYTVDPADITHRALRLSGTSRTVANGCGVRNFQGSLFDCPPTSLSVSEIQAGVQNFSDS